MKELWDAYQAGTLGGEKVYEEKEPPCDADFCDSFEANWFSLKTYVSQFGETFESTWFTNNIYINEGNEDFELTWFTNNTYVTQGNEDFEAGDWDE